MTKTSLALASLALFTPVLGCGPGDTSPSDGGQRSDAPVADGATIDGARPDGRTPGSDGSVVGCNDQEIPSLRRELVGTFDRPVHIAQPPNSSDLYVVESAGAVRIVRDGEPLEDEFLDIRSVIGPAPDDGDEPGLLSIAFHPTDANRFFVGYTPTSGTPRNVVAEGRRTASNPDRGEMVMELLMVPDPAPNHNGGLVLFGPDGYLYAGLGDGGGACDQHGALGPQGQNVGSALGKILRLDASTSGVLGIPPANPFVDVEGARDEIWEYGLRNPWRFSFDRRTGDLWIGDVGQDNLEEIDVSLGNPGGQNYGWSAFEGTSEECEFARCECDDTLREGSTHHRPLITYNHDLGNSIVGGYVYRGSAIPALQGTYLYGDSLGNFVHALRFCEGELQGEPAPVAGLSEDAGGYGLVSFGEDNEGELYLVYLTGEVYKVVAQ